jgi:hypothetical protein
VAIDDGLLNRQGSTQHGEMQPLHTRKVVALIATRKLSTCPDAPTSYLISRLQAGCSSYSGA